MKNEAKRFWQYIKVENELRWSYNKARENGLKFHVCYRLFILAEKESNSGVREGERLKKERKR